jgi:hypothetical protein
MWANEGALFQKSGIMNVQELISAADLNCDGSMSMEEFLDFVKKNAEANEEAMFQVPRMAFENVQWFVFFFECFFFFRQTPKIKWISC